MGGGLCNLQRLYIYPVILLVTECSEQILHQPYSQGMQFLFYDLFLLQAVAQVFWQRVQSLELPTILSLQQWHKPEIDCFYDIAVHVELEIV